MAQVQSVRAMVSRSRGMRARVGVLEDVRRAAREEQASDCLDGAAWERFDLRKSSRRVDREEDGAVYDAARWRIRRRDARRAGQSRDDVSKDRTG